MKKYLWPMGAVALLPFALTACGGTGSVAPAGGIPVQITETDFHVPHLPVLLGENFPVLSRRRWGRDEPLQSSL